MYLYLTYLYIVFRVLDLHTLLISVYSHKCDCNLLFYMKLEIVIFHLSFSAAVDIFQLLTLKIKEKKKKKSVGCNCLLTFGVKIIFFFM